MKVPLIFSEPPPEFGELKSNSESPDQGAMPRDPTYVSGFSELRFARDKAINDVRQGRLRASEVPTLSFNLRWARCQTMKGDPDNRKVVRAGNRGYKMVTKEQVGEGKLIPELPAGADFQADGTIRLGDTVLMMAPAKRVAQNEFAKRQRTEHATANAEAGFTSALETVGAHPSLSKEVGQRVRAELTPKSKSEGK